MANHAIDVSDPTPRQLVETMEQSNAIDKTAIAKDPDGVYVEATVHERHNTVPPSVLRILSRAGYGIERTMPRGNPVRRVAVIR